MSPTTALVADVTTTTDPPAVSTSLDLDIRVIEHPVAETTTPVGQIISHVRQIPHVTGRTLVSFNAV